jgi:hypothetical protein
VLKFTSPGPHMSSNSMSDVAETKRNARSRLGLTQIAFHRSTVSLLFTIGSTPHRFVHGTFVGGSGSQLR